jgi:hypothetical protein
MSTPDTPRHPDGTRNTRDRQRPEDERDETVGVDDIPAIGLPAEDVELDRRPRR